MRFGTRFNFIDGTNINICKKHGAYVWTVMPFGGKNCPATWARASDFVFNGLPDLIKYIDDICIASEEDDAHL